MLADLESSWDALSWMERRALAVSLREMLAQTEQHEAALRLFHLLADDPKWEVRKEIASLLPLLSDAEFVPLAARLTDDSNGFVRKAAERALSIRRKGTRAGGYRGKGIDQVLAQFDLFGSTHGKKAGDKTRTLAMRLYEVVVGATVHDLRGVLTSACANVARLQNQAAQSSLDGPAIQDGLRKVADRLAYLEKFVDAMSIYSQAIPPERATVRLAQVVGEAHGVALDALRPAHLDTKRVNASIAIDDSITVVLARHQIVAAIANVLKNAYEAVYDTDDGRPGHVSITAERVGDAEVRIVIRDNGIGVKADDLRELRAFVPGRTTKKGSGTGFGLPIVHRYIAAHGGAISIDSAENVGTTVSIVLPLESQQEPDE
ncbi:MAG: ATP-binding protein [Thermoguttaceae bacterium]